LIELLPQAKVTTETQFLDFGNAEARFRLVSGWSADETATDGMSFVWAVGPSSTVSLFVAEPRPLQLVFRCWPFHYAGAPPQRFELSVNGNDIGRIDLGTSPSEYRMSIPVHFQVSGENTVEIRYDYNQVPGDVIPGSLDERPLAVGWDWLRLDGAVDSGSPESEADATALVLPFHTRVDYYLPAAPNAALVIDDIDTWGAARDDKSYLMISVQSVSERIEERIDDISSSDRIEVPLPAAGEGHLVRVSLEPKSGVGRSRQEAGLRLVRPTVRSPRSSVPAADFPREPRRPNIIVYLIDTLRADHLGCYGYSGSTARIDRFAGDATLFERTFAQSSWTRPSVASILTGLGPRAHAANRRADALPQSVLTLAEQVAPLGYETAGLVTNTNVASAFGFDQGFETYELLSEDTPQLGYVKADRLVARAIRWLENRPADRPFFLYLHANDPHDPYLLPQRGASEPLPGTMPFMKALEAGEIEPSAGIREKLLELYAGEVSFSDTQFGALLDYLEGAGLYDSSIIVLLSDHGEEFDDHGWWRHGKTLYGEQLNVPLIIKWPDGFAAGKKVRQIAQHIDLVPTLLDALGESPPAGLQGRSLWQLVQSSPPGGGHPAVLSYLVLDGRELESIIFSGQKLIRTFIYDRTVPPYQLFDIDADRMETTNISTEEPVTVDFLHALLRRPTNEPSASAHPIEIDEELERSLRALGYIK
jgi:arylsulfatase A-like enzyme